MSEFNGTAIANYPLSLENASLNKFYFLNDYSEFLFKNKIYDRKIINWQYENKELLLDKGLNLDLLRKENFIF